MEPPDQPQTATVLFEDKKTHQPVTLYTHNEQFCFIISKEKLQQSNTLKALCKGSDIQNHKITLSDTIKTPQAFRLLLHHLYYTEAQRTESVAKCSSRLIIGLTDLTNFLDIPPLLDAYTERICTLASELNDDQLNHHLTAVNTMSTDQKNAIKKSALDLKIHLFWLQRIHPGFFLQPQEQGRPKMGSWLNVTQTKTQLCQGDKSHVDCKELENFDEFRYMRDNLTALQYLLLIFAKKQRDQNQPLDVANYPLLNAAFSAITNQKVREILIKR